MHPACELCGGACCESFVVPVELGLVSPDTRRWLRMRGRFEAAGLRVNAACENLEGGRCAVHASRPQVCREYEVGGVACRAAVRARRSEWRDIFRGFDGGA